MAKHWDSFLSYCMSSIKTMALGSVIGNGILPNSNYSFFALVRDICIGLS